MSEGTLITCGLVCSGVASRKAWRSYIKSLRKHYGHVSDYRHRPKNDDNHTECANNEMAVFADGSIKQGTLLMKSWKRTYGGHWGLRPTCHQCPYHSINRIEDITIGDYWGLDNFSSFWDPRGTSLVIFNNKEPTTEWLKKQLLNKSSFEELPLNAAVNDSQPRLSSSSAPNSVRASFLKSGANGSWERTIATCVMHSAFNKTFGANSKSALESIRNKPIYDSNHLSNRLVDNKQDCYGCGACVQLCPRNAITMVEDSEGFLYPAINEKLCVNCGLCNRACPRSSSSSADMRKGSNSYALRLNDSHHYSKSSSGGAFWGLAQSVLDMDGVVYGTAFSNNLIPEVIRCDSEKDCERCMGSKYVQSDTGLTFKQVKKDLMAGKTVLFTGTPCQIAGLKAYLRRT